jgi:hypothetical protein
VRSSRRRGTGETVVFLAHIQRGFGVPAGDFLRGLFYFYRIELVHLVPNSIIVIDTFIHLYEAYLGIAPHFHLWRHSFELKKTGKVGVVGSVGFMLRRLHLTIRCVRIQFLFSSYYTITEYKLLFKALNGIK